MNDHWFPGSAQNANKGKCGVQSLSVRKLAGQTDIPHAQECLEFMYTIIKGVYAHKNDGLDYVDHLSYVNKDLRTGDWPWVLSQVGGSSLAAKTHV